MSRRPSELPAVRRLWGYVPTWDRAQDDRGDGTLRGLLEAFGVGLDAARDDVRRLLDEAFVDSCDPSLIPLIGRLVGARIDLDVPVNRQRYFVKHHMRERARRGTAQALGELAWGIIGTDAEVQEQAEPEASHDQRPPTTVITGRAPAMGERSLSLTGGDVHVRTRLARPVRRRRDWLQPCANPYVHQLPGGARSLRRADGSCILRTDAAEDEVGVDLSLEQLAEDGSWSVCTPRCSFRRIAPDEVPDVAPGWVVIDPEAGRVAGCPREGPATVRWRMSYWEALEAELVEVRPTAVSPGIYVFTSSDFDPSLPGALHDAYGRRLEPAGSVARPGPGIVRLQQLDERRYSVETADTARTIDRVGLRRYFRFVDHWGWERFEHVRLVAEHSSDELSLREVEVDVDAGTLRVNGALDEGLVAYVWRPFVRERLRAELERALQQHIPIGRKVDVELVDRGYRGYRGHQDSELHR